MTTTAECAENLVPLDGEVNNQILLSSCIAEAGSKLSIGARWIVANGSYWIQASAGGGTGELCIRWISKRYEGVFAVLESSFSALDRELPAQFSIVEVVNKNSLRLLDARETEKVLPHIQVEIVGRRIWSAEKRQEVLVHDIESIFGSFSSTS